MTYGWAILVVLAAIGALAYFGVLSPDNFLPSKCTISPQFACKEFKVDTTGNIQMQIQNNYGKTVDANFSLSNADCTFTSGGNESNGHTGVRNGADFEIVSGTGLINFTCNAGLSEGTKYAADITISYKDSSQALVHTATGTLQSKVEI